MMTMFLRVLCVLAAGVFGSWARAQDEPLPKPATVAEQSDYARTSTYADVQKFLEALAEDSERVRLSSIGTTSEGREIPLAIVAEPPVEKAEDVGDRMTVLLIGDIHAGEVCGKGALCMLAREIAQSKESPLLKDLVLCFVPVYNADGNEKFAATNRPGQVGPEEMGTRESGQGLDLNRDYVKLEASETRALVRFMNRWDPTVIVDTHTTNGSHHRFTVTYQGPKNPAGDVPLLKYVRDTMLPKVDEDFEKASGYRGFFYGYFVGADHTKWVTYPDGPRYGVAYRGMRNRISIITEAYAYATFKDRVLGTEAFCRSILGYAASHKEELKKLVEAADGRTIDAGRGVDSGSTIALRSRVEPFDKKVTILGYEETRAEGQPVKLGGEVEYEAELVNKFVPTLEVRRPWAYVFPGRMAWLKEKLQQHGIEVEVLREDVEADVEAYQISGFARAEKEFEGHRLVSDVQASAVPASRRLEAGWFVVKSGQKLGNLACYLLEPQSEDGLTTWNFFDDALEEGGEFPVLRLMSRTPLTTRAARPLTEDQKAGRRLTYEDVYGRDRVDLDGDAVRGIRWEDAQRYLQRKDGAWRLVHAVTGRSEPAETDFGAIAKQLAALPTVDEKQAEQIARARFARADDKGVVFEHEGDLYFAKADGSGARRLTSSPEEEEMAELSPTGEFVAFVRDNNLWVVDVQTGTERAITTGGSDEVRYGKQTWVYYEELYGRSWKAFWWSPDGRHLAYFRTDASMVPVYELTNDLVRTDRLERERYPRPGEPNPHVSVWIASAAGGRPREVDLSAYDEGAFLISWIDWSKATGNVRFGVQDRVQTWMDVLEVGTNGGTPKKLFRETTEAWVESQGAPTELKDGRFIMASERDGYRHLYLYKKDGTLENQITKGPWEARSIERVDEDGGWVYFSGTADSSIASNLYRIKLDGTGLERLTKEPGDHRVEVSPDGRLFIDTWSSVTEPPKVALRSADGALVRWIDTNPVYELDEWQLGNEELVKIPSEKGVEFEGLIVYPTDFDESKRYPVWFETYGGPHAPTVRDDWGGGRLSDRLLAEQGIIVFHGDPYPASGKGAKSAWTTYKRMGVRELADIEEMIRWITAKPWADGSRVGMSGHSFGGYITAYALTHSELFSAGIAGAPPTDWRDYDTIYTERYMLTPQENPEGYDETSVVAGAKNLHGRLLLLHGMIDNNVHPQNTVRFVDALVDAEKQFDLFMYPGRRHGIWGGHYTRLMYDFMIEQMKPGAESRDSERKEEGSESEMMEEEGVGEPIGP